MRIEDNEIEINAQTIPWNEISTKKENIIEILEMSDIQLPNREKERKKHIEE